MKKIAKLLMGLTLALGLVAMAEGPASAYYCLWYNPVTGQCASYSVDLLPGAHWCVNGGAPGVNEITIFTGTNYDSASTGCQTVTLGNVQIPGLANYDLSGPTWYIKSIWQGANVHSWFYQYTNYNGGYRAFAGSNYYENDFQTHTGWLAKSFGAYAM